MSEFLPYLAPSRVARRTVASLSAMQTRTSSPVSLPFLVAISMAVSRTFCMTASLRSAHWSMSQTASRRPSMLTSSEKVIFCMYCVFFARRGLRPRLVRSDIAFLRWAMDSRTGVISSARRARKYTSSLFDSKARRGRFSATDPRWTESEPLSWCGEAAMPPHDDIPFENATCPPSATISETASDTSETRPRELSMTIPTRGVGVSRA